MQECDRVQLFDNNFLDNPQAAQSKALSATTAFDYDGFFSKCNYNETQTLNNALPSGNKNDLFIMHIDIRRVQKNIDKLVNFLSEFKQQPELVLLTLKCMKWVPWNTSILFFSVCSLWNCDLIVICCILLATCVCTFLKVTLV